MEKITDKNENDKKKIPRLLGILPLIAAASYLLHIFNIISFLNSSIISFISFLILAISIFIFLKKEKYSKVKKTRYNSILGVIIFVCIIIIVIIIFLIANTSEPDKEVYHPHSKEDYSRLIGNWECIWTTITFKSDGSVTYETYSGSWKLENDKLKTIVGNENIPDETIIYDYYFSDNYNTLTLTDEEGRVNVFTKV